MAKPKTLKRKFIDAMAGQKWLQPLYEWLYSAGVYGMNYGNDGLFSSSGELNVAQSIKQNLQKHYQQLNLFDVGGNSGQYALQLAQVFDGTEHQLYCFEPSPVIFEKMAEAVKCNAHIFPVHIGMSNKAETLTLYKRSAMSGLSSVYNRRLEHFKMDMPIQESIQLTRLDDFCTEKGIDRIHFLKMDIEGHELKALEGASSLLAKEAIDFIQFEFGGCNIDSRTYFQDFWYLLKDHYHFYRIIKNGIVPITQYNERLEIFKNVNFLLALKSKKYDL